MQEWYLGWEKVSCFREMSSVQGSCMSFTRSFSYREVIDGVGNVMYVIIPAVFTDSFQVINWTIPHTLPHTIYIHPFTEDILSYVLCMELPMCSVYDSSLCIQGMMQGVLRGTGKQLSGAIINFISFYLIGLPVGTLLAIVAKLGALGMWIGLLIPSTLQVWTTPLQSCDGHMTLFFCFSQAILYFVIVLTLNWEKESLKVRKVCSEFCALLCETSTPTHTYTN